MFHSYVGLPEDVWKNIFLTICYIYIYMYIKCEQVAIGWIWTPLKKCGLVELDGMLFGFFLGWISGAE